MLNLNWIGVINRLLAPILTVFHRHVIWRRASFLSVVKWHIDSLVILKNYLLERVQSLGLRQTDLQQLALYPNLPYFFVSDKLFAQTLHLILVGALYFKFYGINFLLFSALFILYYFWFIIKKFLIYQL